MKYLSPVINHVHNKLNTHITIKLNGGRYSLPAKATTKLDFDIMSLANGFEREDLFSAIASKYIAVDVMVLKDGEYIKAGEYSAVNADGIPKKKPAVKSNSVKAEDIANKLGISVKDTNPNVVKEQVKAESITKVTTKEEPALDPVKDINKPRIKPAPVKKEAPVKESVLDHVKDNAEKGE